MAQMTEMTSVELVIPVRETTVHRTIEQQGDHAWLVLGTQNAQPTALAAMLAVREEFERNARHPVRIEIRWRGVPADFKPPATGTELRAG